MGSNLRVSLRLIYDAQVLGIYVRIYRSTTHPKFDPSWVRTHDLQTARLADHVNLS